MATTCIKTIFFLITRVFTCFSYQQLVNDANGRCDAIASRPRAGCILFIHVPAAAAEDPARAINIRLWPASAIKNRGVAFFFVLIKKH